MSIRSTHLELFNRQQAFSEAVWSAPPCEGYACPHAHGSRPHLSEELRTVIDKLDEHLHAGTDPSDDDLYRFNNGDIVRALTNFKLSGRDVLIALHEHVDWVIANTDLDETHQAHIVWSCAEIRERVSYTNELKNIDSWKHLLCFLDHMESPHSFYDPFYSVKEEYISTLSEIIL